MLDKSIIMCYNRYYNKEVKRNVNKKRYRRVSKSKTVK